MLLPRNALLIVGLALTATLPAQAADKALPKCCVWRVTNAPAPFYFVGSVHALGARDYPLPSPYEMALRDSKKFLFEFDPKRNAEVAARLDAAEKYPPGQNIRNRIHGKLLLYLQQHAVTELVHYDKKTRKYETHFTGFSALEQIRPWALAITMGVPGYSDISSKYGIDDYFADAAKKTGKEVGGLETPAQHVQVLSGLTDLDGELLLLDTIVYQDRSRPEFDHVRSAWRRGDVNAVWASQARRRREAWWIEDRLVGQRNARWIPEIIEAIKSKKPTAVVAGALHFCGPGSVVELLRKRGYQVEQL